MNHSFCPVLAVFESGQSIYKDFKASNKKEDFTIERKSAKNDIDRHLDTKIAGSFGENESEDRKRPPLFAVFENFSLSGFSSKYQNQNFFEFFFMLMEIFTEKIRALEKMSWKT